MAGAEDPTARIPRVVSSRSVLLPRAFLACHHERGFRYADGGQHGQEEHQQRAVAPPPQVQVWPEALECEGEMPLNEPVTATRWVAPTLRRGGENGGEREGRSGYIPVAAGCLGLRLCCFVPTILRLLSTHLSAQLVVISSFFCLDPLYGGE